MRNSESTVESRILDAAAACVLAYGVERTTLTEIARRARVSRPTIYRRWPDIRFVLAELLTMRIAGVLETCQTEGPTANLWLSASSRPPNTCAATR